LKIFKEYVHISGKTKSFSVDLERGRRPETLKEFMGLAQATAKKWGAPIPLDGDLDLNNFMDVSIF